jgi:hypothetical protein
MKNSQIAYWVAAFGAVMFVYQIHEISGLEEAAAVWRSQVDAHNNPGVGTYFRAFFDGFTLGAFSQGDVFSEAHKSEREGKQLEATRAALLARYQQAVSYRNWGLAIGVGGVVVGMALERKSRTESGISPIRNA